jgi:hypothetical protein
MAELDVYFGAEHNNSIPEAFNSKLLLSLLNMIQGTFHMC